MKTLILIIIIFSLGCTSLKNNYDYNSCNFDIYNIANDSTHSYFVKLNEFNFNKLDTGDKTNFYGVFRGVYKKKLYNMLVFNTRISSNELIDMNNSNSLVVNILRDTKCFDFSCSFDIKKYIDKEYPVIFGRLSIYKEDPH